MDHWTIIANPNAGKGRAFRHANKAMSLLERCGSGGTLAKTRDVGDVARILRECLGRGEKRFAVCGGDGTIHQVVNAIANTDAVLGIIPCGGGNDLARALGIPVHLESAVGILARGEPTRIDLGRIGERFFGTIASVGFDAAVAERVNEGKGKFSGSFRYVVSALRTLKSFEATDVEIKGDKETYKGKIFLGAIGNAPYYGGGMRMVPGATVNDGHLALCVIKEISKLTVLRSLLRVYQGSHIEMPFVYTAHSKALEIDTPEPEWIYADGEPICKTPARVEVSEGALRVMVRSLD